MHVSVSVFGCDCLRLLVGGYFGVYRYTHPVIGFQRRRLQKDTLMKATLKGNTQCLVGFPVPSHHALERVRWRELCKNNRLIFGPG